MPLGVKSIASGETAQPIRWVHFRIPTAAVLLFFLLGLAQAAADWKPLAERLTADGFNREAMESLFSHPEVLFEPDAMAGKLRSLIKSRSAEDDAALTATLRKAYRRDYLNPMAIERAKSFLTENRAVLEKITDQYGVPKEIIVSILLIETYLGKNTGNRRVFNRLASMARLNDLELVRPYLDINLLAPENEEYARRRCREKADWAYGELKALLKYSARDSVDPLDIRGSVYGAIGLCQFMPSNVFLFGVDADGDGRIDPFARPDALHSIANYLRGHGWREDMDRTGRHRIIFAYNHSTAYADTVLAVADKIREQSRRDPEVRGRTVAQPNAPH